MADFDTFLAKQGLNPIYQGDPPTSESDYNSRVTFMDGETAPSWSEIQAVSYTHLTLPTNREV